MPDDSVSPLREPPVRGVERRNGALVLRLAGEIDLYNANEVREALLQALESRPTKVVVDLTDVDFVDSTALGVLVEARSRLGGTGLLLVGPQHGTRRTLQVSGLDRHLPVHESVDDALHAD
jgi:anti-sigma B factor antagonist